MTKTYWALQAKKNKQEYACDSLGESCVLLLSEQYPPMNYSKRMWKIVKVKIVEVKK